MAWKHDFFEIDVNKVRVNDVDPNFECTPHGYTRDQIAQWVRDLKEIQQLCRDRGYTEGDFQQMRFSPDVRERSLGESYHKFYDHDPSGERMNHDFIAVVWVGDHYEVTNGRYRLEMAQQMGLRHVPARVSAADEATLHQLRMEGERIAAGEQPLRRNEPVWERATAREQRRQERER